MRTRLICSLLVWLAPCHLAAARAFDDVIDSPMYQAPDLPGPRVEVVYGNALELWLKALARPEAEMKYRAAEAITLAHRGGVKGLDTAIAPLLKVLDRTNQHPMVRLAVARTLITLEARQAAPSLFRQARSGNRVLRDLVEPALARWDYKDARKVWLKRLRDSATPHRSLLLAVRGLATVRESKAADGLRALVLGARVPGPICLEAAQALGLLRNDGLEHDAARLSADTSARAIPARLAAAALLRQHRSAAAIRLLQRLTRDPEPAVAARAVARLIEIDPQRVVPSLEHLLTSPDATLRTWAVTVLFRLPTSRHIRLLGDRLDDLHLDVRGKARRALRELAAKKDFRLRVIAEATRLLAARSWRGLEQATILLTQLKHQPAAERFVELLTFDRPEVFITAAWGLRKLAVPETLPGVLSHVRAKYKQFRGAGGQLNYPVVAVDHQLSQLNQFLGEQRYGPAEAQLRQFIPRQTNPMAPESRAAGIWALGLIHNGKTIPALATALQARLNDLRSIPPEIRRVRRMAAVTLGRLKAKETLLSLRRHYAARQPSDDPVNNACGWAIEQITGEVMPPPKTLRPKQRDGFLAPQP